MKKFFKENWILVTIVIFASFLRLWNLSNIPVGFNDDEASFGYNAYSILKTGRDEWSRLLPFPVFESFGDWKLVFYLYLTIPSILIFGLTEFATRLPSAIFGILAVYSTYLLSEKLFNKKIALLSAFFLTISPWHIAASRNAFESDILIFFLTMAVYFFIKGTEQKKYLIPSFLGFVLSLYIYRSAWIFTPLIVGSLIFLYRKNLEKQKINLMKILVIPLILTIPILLTALSFSGQSRFFQESFIHGVQIQGIIAQINEKRGNCQENYPNLLCVTTYNRPIFFLTKFIDNYIQNLSWDVYFLRGTLTGYQGFAPRGFLYFFELPLIILGIISLVKKNVPSTRLLFLWILIIPLAPSLTGAGNPGRLNIILPVPQILISLGIAFIFSNLKSKLSANIFILGLTTVIFASFLRFAVDTTTDYPKYAGKVNRYGYKELFQFIENKKESYDKIIVSRISDDAKQYIHYLFFTKFDPSTYQHDIAKARDEMGWNAVSEIQKLMFYKNTPNLTEITNNTLVATGEEIKYKRNTVKIINDLRGDRLFEIYTVNSNYHEN